jgi:hypothetical protein
MKNNFHQINLSSSIANSPLALIFNCGAKIEFCPSVLEILCLRTGSVVDAVVVVVLIFILNEEEKEELKIIEK